MFESFFLPRKPSMLGIIGTIGILHRDNSGARVTESRRQLKKRKRKEKKAPVGLEGKHMGGKKQSDSLCKRRRRKRPDQMDRSFNKLLRLTRLSFNSAQTTSSDRRTVLVCYICSMAERRRFFPQSWERHRLVCWPKPRTV